MNAMFKNLTTDGLEEAEDRLGGGFGPLETDIYTGTIKAMYAGQADSGAHSVTVLIDIDGREYRETLYVTNRKGENFWVNEKAGNKRMPLPGFTTVNDICLVASGKPLCEQENEDKVVMVYDGEARKELPKTVPMLTECVGATITVAIQKILENKSKKEGNSYVDTAETRESNQIEKVFDTESRLTVVEATNGVTEAAFHDAWLEKNKGVTRDKRTIKDGQAGTAGRPAGNSAGTTGSTGRKNLFGKKD